MQTSVKSLKMPTGTVTLRLVEAGEGHRFLLLHGGVGPASMRGLAEGLSQIGAAILPTHPGFDGEPRPSWLTTIRQLAELYAAMLEEMDVRDVTVIGNSAGGWIAAEMALLGASRIAGIVLMNAVGIDADPLGQPIVEPMVVSPEKRALLAFHDPARFAIAPSGPEAAAAMIENQRTLRVYAGEPFMHDPTLRRRLAAMTRPALVLWGESDGVVDLAYGKRYAAAVPGSRFEAIAEAGPFPQIEQRDEVLRRIGGFAGFFNAG
jgi:pimeloyl-ACP methyl ester carboxylesterase